MGASNLREVAKHLGISFRTASGLGFNTGVVFAGLGRSMCDRKANCATPFCSDMDGLAPSSPICGRSKDCGRSLVSLSEEGPILTRRCGCRHRCIAHVFGAVGTRCRFVGSLGLGSVLDCSCGVDGNGR